ncbi:hypothetical protein Mal4_56520 [Maioricimonas rarisocia]|uniref:Uncharacterized protein n=1 Tax=Maioricimonas rarisocia TaxID=2528026 RepID=A0A517ZFN8_9PLAN|nr:hypothetical protein [Maioricimonas rarisocia]QDU41286.1 hypothetical protein Mal4_56520 [Maioricimonas rarisocia]
MSDESPAPSPDGNDERHSGQRLWLTVIAVVCGSVSGVALLLHAAGLLRMYFLVDFLGPVSLVGLLLCGVYARQVHADVFLQRLLVGAWASLVATLAYDIARYPLWKSGVFDFNPFRAHPLFGELITGQPAATWTAFLVGWIYHFWNGFGFGVMYTVVAGPAHWWYAVIWALFLEVAWLVALPSVVNLTVGVDAIAVSLIGHGIYGVVLGLLSQRFIRK